MGFFLRKVLLLTAVFTIILVCNLQAKNVYAVSKSSKKAEIAKTSASTGTNSQGYRKYNVTSRSTVNPIKSVDINSLISFAKKHLGIRYIYGGSGRKGFDCSGFTMFIMDSLGVKLPHSASAQSYQGVKVSRDSLKPGDLVYFATSGGRNISHVGLYIGEGNFIHAASNEGVTVNNLNEKYYKIRYVTANRIVS